VTNPNIANHPVSEIFARVSHKLRIVRIKRHDRIMSVHAEEKLQLQDVILAVGDPDALKELEILIGEHREESVPQSEEARSRWVIVSARDFVGRKVNHLQISQLYGVVITRVRRSDVEFLPRTRFTFEAGDEVRVSGTPQEIEKFRLAASKDRESLHETDMLTFSLGLVLAVFVGLLRIPLGEKLSLSLGIAGGPLIVGLLFGYFGRFGKLSGHMPKAANLIIGELGLYLFLAAAGCQAGVRFLSVFEENGILLMICGALITLVPILFAVFVARYVLKLNFLLILGMVSGGMTSTPALAVLTENTKSDIPALGYTAIYPVAILLTTLMAQLLAYF